MTDQRSLKYFLGGSTSCGFYSLYDSFVSLAQGDFLWIIKGGTLCGKSSFLKMIGSAAEAAGLRVEYALSPDDPAVPDGVYIPSLKTAYIDGDAPHTAETNLYSADSAYIDLGEFCDRDAISKFREELGVLRAVLENNYDKIYALLGAAGKLRSGWQGTFASEAGKAAVSRRINALALREFGKRRRTNGKISRRFLSALTYDGLKAFPGTAGTLCRRIYVLENRYRLGGPALNTIAEAALCTGRDIIACPDPLVPGLLEAVLVPSLSLGFTTSDSGLASVAGARHIRLDAMAEEANGKRARQELRRCEKLISALTEEAVSVLGEAKLVRDEIAKIYEPNVDLGAVSSLAAKHIRLLGLSI